MVCNGRCLAAFCVLLTLIMAEAPRATAGSALLFDGDDYVDVADPIDLRGPLSVEAWLRVDVADGGRIVSNRNAGNGFEIDIINDGRLRFTINGSSSANVNLSAYFSDWFHLAVTWEGPSGSEVVFYVNGEQVGTGFESDEPTEATGTFRIGKSASGFAPFSGAIDELRVWSTVLSESTIQTWRGQPLTPDHPDFAHLEAAWDFEEGGGQFAASFVDSPGRDGQLGSTSMSDDADPQWIISGAIPVRLVTVSELKRVFREHR